MYKTARIATSGVTCQAQALTFVTSSTAPGATTITAFDGTTFAFTPPASSVFHLDIAVRGPITIGANTTVIAKG